MSDSIENEVVPYNPEEYDSKIDNRISRMENVSQNLRDMVSTGNELVRYSGSIARDITARITESRNKIAELNHELAIMDSERITAAQHYAMIKPSIEKAEDEIKDILQMMKSFDLNNLNEKALQAYNSQMLMMAGLRQQIMDLYEKVLG